MLNRTENLNIEILIKKISHRELFITNNPQPISIPALNQYQGTRINTYSHQVSSIFITPFDISQFNENLSHSSMFRSHLVSEL